MTLTRDLPRPYEQKPLTYAEQQGRLCAEDAFSGATERLMAERPGALTYDDFLAAWGEVVELLIVKSEVALEMRIFTPGERLLWLHEAIETVVEKARLRFLSSIRHIEKRGQFAPGMHDNIGLVRGFLMCPEMRASNSFDALIAAR